MDKEFEIRSFSGQASPVLTENRTVEGYAIVFNQESRVMYDPEKRRYFIEVIKPEAITTDLITQSDVRALAEHNRERMLARSFNGKGTLTLTKDEYGVKYRFEAPKTVDGDYVVEMISRGDIFGSSFCYGADEKDGVKYTKRSDGLVMREVTKISRFVDVSVVSNPAYYGTNVSVRSIEEFERSTEEPVKEDDLKWKEELDSLRKRLK